MGLVEIIKNNFNKGYFDKAMIIDSLPNECPAWTIKSNEWYGVVVPTESTKIFNEKFSSVKIGTMHAEINGDNMDLLALTCSDVSLRDEFAVICSEFVQPGINCEKRNNLTSHPEEWWNNWKDLLGNKSASDQVYPVMGELLVVEKLFVANQLPKWSAVEHSTHDIELSTRSYEVKSTIKRYGYDVEISSIYQLKKSGETLDLVFMRFEESILGDSIDDIVERLGNLGASVDLFEAALSKQGLEKGCTARESKYKLLEMKVFPVDDFFPALTIGSFVGGALPAHVKGIKYILDLVGIEGKATLS